MHLLAVDRVHETPEVQLDEAVAHAARAAVARGAFGSPDSRRGRGWCDCVGMARCIAAEDNQAAQLARAPEQRRGAGRGIDRGIDDTLVGARFGQAHSRYVDQVDMRIRLTAAATGW